MAITNIGDVSNQVIKRWAPMFTKELRQSNILVDLLDKSYQGDIQNQGDTVYVSQINAPTGELLTVGTDADSFSSEQLSMSRVTIQANKRAVAAFEFEDLAILQSQLDSQDSEIRESLLYAVSSQINTYLYSLMVPSASAPDHQIVSTDMNSATVSAARTLAATAKWPNNQPWYGVLDPSYYSDVLNDTTLASSDFGGQDRPVIGGQVSLPRYGFQLVEDNSLSTDTGYFFYKDCMHLVMQTMPTFKISDLHAQKKFGYLISVDVIFGAALGVSGDNKMIKYTGS